MGLAAALLVSSVFVGPGALSVAQATGLPAGCQVFEGAHLKVNGQQIFPDVPLLVNAGRMLVPLRIIAETLGAEVGWDGERRVALVDTPTRHIEMPIGADVATVNGHEITLDAAAVLYLSRTLVPVRFVAESLGSNVSWDDDTRTAIITAPEAGVLGQVELELRPGCAVLYLAAGEDVPYSVKTLADPPRLIVDLEQTTSGLDWSEMPVGRALVDRVRIGSLGVGVTRVVCDLQAAVRFNHRRAEGRPGVEVEICYQVAGAEWEDGGLTIHASGPLTAKSFALAEPYRYVIDLPGTTLSGGGMRTVEVDDDNVSRARIAQFQSNPDIVRVVLDLKQPRAYSITEHQTGLRVESETEGGAALQLRYVNTPDGGRFTLETDAAAAAVAVAPDGRQLRLTVDGLGAGEAEGRQVGDGLVRFYEVVDDPGEASFSVIVHLTGYAGHELTESDRQVILEIDASPAAGRKIVVDPGHGGRDPGATSYSGVYEKDVNWPIALLLKERLERAGARVVLTRDEDTSIDAYGRVAVANDWGADVFVSIHCNAYYKQSSSGTEVFHYGDSADSADSARLARLMMAELAKLGLVNRGVKVGNYAVCRESNMPAVLLELGFLTNPGDEKVLLDPDKQAHSADLIFQALQSYFR